MIDDPVHKPVGDGVLGREEAVALHVRVDTFDRLAGVLGVQLIDASAQRQNLLGVDLDIGRLPLVAPRGLVDQDPAGGQGEALARGSAAQEQRPHRHRDPVTDRRDVGADELHRVVDRQAVVDGATWRVDVQVDVLVGVVGLEVDQLRDDQVGGYLVDLAAEEHDAIVEQARVDVERALTAGGLLDDHRDQGHLSPPW